MFYTNVCKKGDYVYHTGYDNIGKKFIVQEKFKPYIYYKVNDGEDISLYGDTLKKKVFENVNEVGKFVHNNRELIDLYGDVSPCAQFISETYKDKVKYNKNYIRIWWLDIEVKTDGEFPIPEAAKYPIVAITVFDTRYNKYIVLGLGDYKYDYNRIKFNADVTYKKCENEIDLMDKFIQLIQKFKPDIWIAHNGENFDYPYIINRLKNIGLNPDDLSLFGKAKSSCKEVTENHITKKKYSNKVDGISLMDNMIMYKKYISDPRESYSLSNLAVEDLNMDKLNYDEYDNLEGLYEKNYTKYMDYNINDVYLMVLLNEKNGYVDLHIRNTYVTKCENFEIAMSPVAIWDTYIYHTLKQNNIQIPPSKTNADSFDYIGAFVVPTINKKHKWVVSIDVNSMYPHTQMEWNISPEKLVTDLTVSQWLQTLTEEQIDEYIVKSDNPMQIKFLEDLKETNKLGLKVNEIRQDDLDERMLNMVIPTHPDYIMTANGYYFRKDGLGVIPKLLHENYAERKHIKSVLIKDIKKKLKSDPNNKKLQEELNALDVAQLGIKIMMNSEYGALANNYFRYCKYELCSSITMNGQMMDRTLIKAFKEKYPLIDVIAGDTDSLYLSLEKIVEENCKGMSEDEIITWIDKFSTNEIQKVIDDTFVKIQKFFGAPDNYMKMSREKVIMSAIWTGKKHYAYKMIIEDDNRLENPKYGYKGLECIKSSTPNKVRDLLKYTINSLLDDKNVSDIMNECKNEIMKMSPEDIAFPKSCNGLQKYAMEGDKFALKTPAHVKAAHVYNRYLKENNITDYPYIAEGNKIRYVYLKEPNSLNASSFGFINRFPKDENIIKYIDYDTMYEKAYGKVITDMLKKIGLQNTVSTSVNLDDLF